MGRSKAEGFADLVAATKKSRGVTVRRIGDDRVEVPSRFPFEEVLAGLDVGGNDLVAPALQHGHEIAVSTGWFPHRPFFRNAVHQGASRTRRRLVVLVGFDFADLGFRPVRWTVFPILAHRAVQLETVTSWCQLAPHGADKGWLDAQHLANPAIGTLGGLCQLVRHQLPFLRRRQLPSGEVQGSGKGPLLAVVQPVLNKFGTIVSEFRCDFFADNFRQ